MKSLKKYILFLLAGCLLTVSCDDALDTKVDMYLTDDMLATLYSQMFNFGYKAYTNVPYGFYAIDGNLFATVSDEAQYVTSYSSCQRFVEGTWNAFYNPDDFYSAAYVGIHDANYYLENSIDYKNILARNRDTLNYANLQQYKQDVQNCEWLRNEARVLRAYYYLELLKRYGGVPLITKTYQDTDEANLPRESVERIVDFIVSEIDAVKDGLQINWINAGFSGRDGRITKGAALAVKSRALLYAASPLFNSSGSKAKWESAAAAAQEIIASGGYSLHADYRGLFITDVTNTNSEVIWTLRLGQTNDFERKNYPIGTPGGGTGVCPSHNLVAAYEYKTAKDPENPYAGLDPRFEASIVYNNSQWNGRTIEIWSGGTDDQSNANASPTGYYLKKFLNENLNLVNDAKEIRSWIIFRYAEILLNYAEAMNEAYGPDNNNGYSLTAREAVNMVRKRSSVDMPDVDVANGDADALRDAIKHERRIELAFEDHRYWDLKRWGDAEIVLNQPVKGIEAVKSGNSIIYSERVISPRTFIAPKMYLYPIPQSEIVKTNGIVEQNAGW